MYHARCWSATGSWVVLLFSGRRPYISSPVEAHTLFVVLLVYLMRRWSECGKLSELSPAAIEQLQTACTQAVTQAYADGVDALVFVAPQHGEGATPEEAAAAQAAAEAAMKIQKNKRVRGSCVRQ